jgi:UDP-N-acetylglucosamine 2-epimerase (non-hydrolysing)
MKILSVVGARPQFIKLALLSQEIRKHFKEVIVHTGQHYDVEMSRDFFDILKIPEPDYNLSVGSMGRDEQIRKMVEGLEKIFLKEKPDLVVVFGDTNSTLAGAKAASKLGIKLAHVEAGMRSYDKIPEEINRVGTDSLSHIFFCSTNTAVENLEKEGITKNVFLVGDIMIDALVTTLEIAKKKSKVLGDWGLFKKDYILATIHRAENTEDESRLKSIIKALISSEEKIVIPLHPRTKKYLEACSLFEKLKNSNVRIIRPLSYLDMLVMEENARKIITDSGGVQKEAYFFRVPCITLRDVTEWEETIENGFNVLVGSNEEKINDAIKNFEIKQENKQLYGKGDASKKIADVLAKLKNKMN